MFRPDHDTPCMNYDPDLWFSGQRTDKEIAKKLCFSCPLREACLEDCLDYEELAGRQMRWGIFGGLDPDQRAQLLNKRISA